MDVIGVDLGGTNIKAGIVDADGVLKKEISVKTPNALGGMAILNGVVHAVRELIKQCERTVSAVGVGTAGRVQKETGAIIFAGDTIPGWVGTEVKAVLEAQLSLQVFVDNDVNTAALGENWLGTARKWDHFAYLAIGTGLGGALVNRGEIIQGIHGGAGEFGHMILYPDGIPCGCGQKGCAEKYVSGTALNDLAREINSDWDSYKLLEKFGDNHELANKAIQKFIRDLSIVLINIQNMFDPEAIILGGGVTDSYGLWENVLHQCLRDMAKLKVNVHPATLGNQAGIFGAAQLAFDGMQSNQQ